MSIQPKGSPPLRKKFLMQLPALMKDLNEGLALVGWPDPAQRAVAARARQFAAVLRAHAIDLRELHVAAGMDARTTLSGW